jgi:hypothetical protein
MKKNLLLLTFFYMALTLCAQNSKNERDNSSGQLPVINHGNKNVVTRTIETRDVKTNKQSQQVLFELENVVHGSQQLQSDYLNRPMTNRDLLSLTGDDNVKAQKLLQQLANNLRKASIEKADGPNAQTSTATVSQNNATGILLKKIQELNRQLLMNHVVNNQANSPGERPGEGHFNTEQNFAQARMEREKQTQMEME